MEQERALESGMYGGDPWYYEPGEYLPFRFLLGTVGAEPLVCVGINPGTAQPGALDNTLKSVERIAKGNGYDSWVMANVCAQRATNPNDIDKETDIYLHVENMLWLNTLLRDKPGATMWAAWGTLINKRAYLWELLGDMAAVCDQYDVGWVTFGDRSKDGHPHHPLYLRKNSQPERFNIKEYLRSGPE